MSKFRYKYLFLAIAAILILAESSCTDYFAALEKHKDWVVTVEGNIVLHTRPKDFSNSSSPDDNAIAIITGNQNFYYLLIKDSLGLHYDDKVLLYLFNYDEALDVIGTNTGGNSMAARSTIYYTFIPGSYKDIYERDVYVGAHEMVKLITNRALGTNFTRLMNEGYAAAFAGSYGRTYDEVEEIVTARSIMEWMEIHYMNGLVLSPEELLFEEGLLDEVFIPNAGLFVRFLWQNYEVQNINILFNLKATDIKTNFNSITGMSFNEMSDSYLEFTDSFFNSKDEE